jgi:hypothetical protein
MPHLANHREVRHSRCGGRDGPRQQPNSPASADGLHTQALLTAKRSRALGCAMSHARQTGVAATTADRRRFDMGGAEAVGHAVLREGQVVVAVGHWWRGQARPATAGANRGLRARPGRAAGYGPRLRRRTSRGAQEQTRRAAADSARGGTLEFTAGSITGPVAEILASAVNESSTGQVTVTSVVKDLALGSSLDLAAHSTTRFPAASNHSYSRLAARHPRPPIGRSGLRGAQSDLI